MFALGREAMHHGVAVAVGDVDLPVGGERHVGRVVEGALEVRFVALADLAEWLAHGGEDQDLVGIPVDQEHPVVARDEDPVRVGDPTPAPGGVEGAVGLEHEDRRIGALKGEDAALRIDRELAQRHQVQVARHLAPGPLHPVATAAHRDHQAVFVALHAHGRITFSSVSSRARRSRLAAMKR